MRTYDTIPYDLLLLSVSSRAETFSSALLDVVCSCERMSIEFPKVIKCNKHHSHLTFSFDI